MYKMWAGDGVKFGYHNILEGRKCCDNCNIWVLVSVDEEDGKMYCPIQEQIVMPSGDCDAYEGWFKLVKGKGE